MVIQQLTIILEQMIVDMDMILMVIKIMLKMEKDQLVQQLYLMIFVMMDYNGIIQLE